MKKILVFMTVVCMAVLIMAGVSFAGTTEAITVNADGELGNGTSYYPVISDNGRYVVFASYASNIGPDDNNGVKDVYFHDRKTGIFELISVSSDGVQGNFDSRSPSLSEDGRYVAFISWADNLVDGGTGNQTVFLRDRMNGTTIAIATTFGPEINQLGNTLAETAMSADGKYVAFSSNTPYLVPEDGRVNRDAFIYNTETGEIELVSKNSEGVLSNGHAHRVTLSSDGRYVAYASSANNLVDGYDLPRWTEQQVYIHDRLTGITELVSQNTEGEAASFMPGQERISISADGRFIVFGSKSDNLVPHDFASHSHFVYIRDRVEGTTNVVNPFSNIMTSHADISDDGRFVTMQVVNVIGGERDFSASVVYDRVMDTGEWVSVNNDGELANWYAAHPTISGDGQYVVFMSAATNLAPQYVHYNWDIYIRDRGPQTPEGAVEYIDNLVDSDVIEPTVAAGLTPKLDSAQDAATSTAADGKLNAFIKQVEAKIKKGDIDAETGATLIEAAQGMIDSN